MLPGLRRLNRYERRIMRIPAKSRHARIRQVGFSRRTKDGFRFPLYALEFGKAAALRRGPAVLTAGVHGLETIGIHVVLDFLESALDKKSPDYMADLAGGDLGLVCMPIVNPGGVVLKRRSNPAGTDLMRNSGVDGESPLPFFGGHALTPRLPYFRGRTLEPESRALMRFLRACLTTTNSAGNGTNGKPCVIPVLDVHSGFGIGTQVWWPYAGKKEASPDDALFRELAERLRDELGHGRYHFGPQNADYRVNGDLWDRIYDAHRLERTSDGGGNALLPFTLEIGTWKDVRESPKRLFDRRKLFNPNGKHKKIVRTSHRAFLRDFVRLAV